MDETRKIGNRWVRVSEPLKRQWEYGRLYGNPAGYVPKQGTIPEKFMLRIAAEGPLFGKETGKDKQPAINLKKAGYLYTTKKGYALTEKGKAFVAKEYQGRRYLAKKILGVDQTK